MSDILESKMDKATARPWKVIPDPGRFCDECGQGYYAEKHLIARCDGTNAGVALVLCDRDEDANADLIVRAVNCFEDLVAACQAKLKAFKGEEYDADAFDIAAKMCEEALTKAGVDLVSKDDPYHDDKIYHMADKANEKGWVSALCFKTPRAINLKRESWTIRREAVTCKKCLAALAKAQGDK